jgi:hypothetical protein
LIPDPDPVPSIYADYRSGSRVFIAKNWKKFAAEKKIHIFSIKDVQDT